MNRRHLPGVRAFVIHPKEIDHRGARWEEVVVTSNTGVEERTRLATLEELVHADLITVAAEPLLLHPGDLQADLLLVEGLVGTPQALDLGDQDLVPDRVDHPRPGIVDDRLGVGLQAGRIIRPKIVHYQSICKIFVKAAKWFF